MRHVCNLKLFVQRPGYRFVAGAKTLGQISDRKLEVVFKLQLDQQSGNIKLRVAERKIIKVRKAEPGSFVEPLARVEVAVNRAERLNAYPAMYCGERFQQFTYTAS